MFSRKSLTLLAAILLTLCAASALAQATVILYHRVGDSRYPSTNVDAETFRAQMQWLRDKGYKVVSTRSIEDHLVRGAALPENAVAIQFDDGFRSVYDNAAPVLEEFGYPYSIFIPTRSIEKNFNDYVTWEQLEELAARGVEIGAHSHGHPRMGLWGEAEADKIEFELNESRKLLKDHGIEARWFAYPYGEYNTELVRRTKAAGYALGFAQDPGALGPASDPFTIPRFAVVGGVSDLPTFKERLTYKALAASELEPGFGIVEDDAPERYALKVAEPGRYHAGQVNMFVSELGRMEATFDTDTGLIQADGLKALTRRINRVLVSLRERDTGRFALKSWILISESE